MERDTKIHKVFQESRDTGSDFKGQKEGAHVFFPCSREKENGGRAMIYTGEAARQSLEQEGGRKNEKAKKGKVDACFGFRGFSNKAYSLEQGVWVPPLSHLPQCQITTFCFVLRASEKNSFWIGRFFFFFYFFWSLRNTFEGLNLSKFVSKYF